MNMPQSHLSYGEEVVNLLVYILGVGASYAEPRYLLITKAFASRLSLLPVFFHSFSGSDMYSGLLR